MNNYKEQIESWRRSNVAGKEFIQWVGLKTPQEAWNECPNGEWLLWWIKKTEPSVDDKQIQLAILQCVMSLSHFTKNKYELKVLKTAIKHLKGKATKEEMNLAKKQVRANLNPADKLKTRAEELMQSATTDKEQASLYIDYIASEASFAIINAVEFILRNIENATRNIDMLTELFREIDKIAGAYAFSTKLNTNPFPISNNFEAMKKAFNLSRNEVLQQCSDAIRKFVIPTPHYFSLLQTLR